MMNDMKAIARKTISLLDLTNLNDDCTPQDIINLCRRAKTPFGNTAAICIWKQFVPQAKKLLSGSGIKIATVVNFPAGGNDTDAVVIETQKAISDGADEIDLVFPYRAFLEGNSELAADQIRQIKQQCSGLALLKVILETGELKEEAKIRAASQLAIAKGADFIKTSTGKVAVNATPQTAKIMLEEIAASKKPIGFKPAGGLKTVADAADYLKLADTIMGKDWAQPETFRFGASSVLDNLLATLEDATPKGAIEGY